MKYKSYDELPLILSVKELSEFLGISKSGAYELVKTKGFPVVKIGARVLIPKDKLIEWIDKQSGGTQSEKTL